MLSLVFLYAPDLSSCSKTICANLFDVQLLLYDQVWPEERIRAMILKL